MKYKTIFWVELGVILILIILLIGSHISLKTENPLIREPMSVAESKISYLPPPHPKPSVDDLKNLADLKKKFTPRVIKITDDVYHAIGFALGSVQMIITEEGLVIIDTTESKESAGEILSAFRKITTKPIKYIIYTHAHFDHVLGSSVFKEKGTKVITVQAAVHELENSFGELADFYNRCRQIQFGNIAEEYVRKRPVKSPVRLPARLNRNDIVWPDIVFKTEYDFTLGGKVFQLYRTTGETRGHLMVWLPQNKVLFCGDLYYKSFPNLSSPMLEPRPVQDWYESLDRMAELKAEFLVPGHTEAVIGASQVTEALSDRSRAIRWVYHQTLKCINEGKSVEEAARFIKLPPELEQKEQFQETYGRIDWSVRGIYQSKTGWYRGNGTGLNPLRAGYPERELIRMAGGADKILMRAIECQKTKEHQLAIELCDIVIRANPDDKTARAIKASSLETMAYTIGNLNMFGFYRSAAAMERRTAGIKP